MADHPTVVHAVARRGTLRVIIEIQYFYCVELSDFKDIIPQFSMAVTLFLGETIVIDFRLSMVMRRVT